LFDKKFELKKLGNTKLRNALPYIILVTTLVVLVTLFVAGLPRGPQMLYPGEVRIYQGEDLSAVANVYENAIRGTQFLNDSSYRLSIDGLVSRPLQLTYNDILDNYQSFQKVITIYCVEGWQARILWEGVLVKDLLLQAGADMNSSVVLFHASDGYTTSLPTSYLVDKNILLAYKMNNITLPPERGFPFMLVAESQYGYKWIKWLMRIEVSKDADYRGYWESRGFPNNATIP
jgi:DMSO/TMAO reductase YedYZ molybdopterin-dependent catalytic subunit